MLNIPGVSPILKIDGGGMEGYLPHKHLFPQNYFGNFPALA